ncbi:DDE-type integrase/transposase/recombinase [Ascidiaceihabitans sp.]|nr:DDE-type integrase/transposase/recombinase [Ascidiaceihabitans sp.]
MKRNNHQCGHHRVQRLMRLVPIYQEPNTSKKHPQHKIWPNLLSNTVIDRPNQAWCADITYIPMRRRFLYLVAIMDRFSRKVLVWRLSNNMDAECCFKALKEALSKHGLRQPVHQRRMDQRTDRCKEQDQHGW